VDDEKGNVVTLVALIDAKEVAARRSSQLRDSDGMSARHSQIVSK
jgi:hypothetical protein